MAPIGGPTGGGQAGFGSGGSFTGPAEALEVIGNHAYAYAGATGASVTEATSLSFTTGNYYFVGVLTVNGACNVDDLATGTTSGFTLKMNGAIISIMKTDTLSEDMPSTFKNAVIIAPYTEVEVLTQSEGNAADRLTSVLLTGRIYRE